MKLSHIYVHDSFVQNIGLHDDGNRRVARTPPFVTLGFLELVCRDCQLRLEIGVHLLEVGVHLGVGLSFTVVPLRLSRNRQQTTTSTTTTTTSTTSVSAYEVSA